MVNVSDLKKQFPIFTRQPDLAYLDSAATALKPASVIEAEQEYYEGYSANIARGLYPNAEKATEKFENVREKAALFLGAQAEEIIFTSGTTDSINLSARLMESTLEKGDNIVTTEIEHHSNYLPWKELAQRKQADFRVVSLLSDGKIDRASLAKLIDQKTKIFAFSAVSNVTGTIQDVREIIQTIQQLNSKTITLVDAAQAIGHSRINVKEWGADLVAFSAHKMFGPTGVGILYGKAAFLKTFDPASFGGGMVLDACAAKTAYKESPYRFESGTPNIAGVIAFGAAIEFIEKLGVEPIRAHEKTLSEYARKKLLEAFGKTIRIFGPEKAEERGGVLAFTMPGFHPHDIAQILGESNICIRAGEHCAAPLHRSLGLAATARLSFSIYNDENDIDKLIEGLQEVRGVLYVARTDF